MLEPISLRVISQDDPTLSSFSSSSDPSNIRLCRRAYLSPDLLRTHRLAAGDWAILTAPPSFSARPESSESRPSNEDETGLGNGNVVVQLWPRTGVIDDGIVLSPCHLLNLSLKSNAPINLIRFVPEKHTRGVLKTVSIAALSTSTQDQAGKIKDEAGEKREIEWVRASIKESLVGSKYFSPKHRLTIGDGMIYTVTSFQVSTKVPRDIVDGLDRLSLNVDIYEMDWRTKIILPSDATSSSHSGPTNPTSKITSTSNTSSSSLQPLSSSSIPSYINFYTPSSPSLSSYSTLGGLDSQITQIRTLLELPLRQPELYTRFNLVPPRGLLLHGPPGTGKTALARAIASSTPGCSCIVVNGPELSSAFHGETEERLRGVFEVARKRSPCIVVLDEVDALCPRRDGGEGGEVERRVVAMLLTLMDGMGGNEGERVLVIAATNRPNSIDPALRRPGRFDREIEIGIPDAVGRGQILDILLAKIPHSLSRAEIDLIAAKTHGYVGADLTSLIRESATAAIQRWHVTTTTTTTTTTSNLTPPILTHADILSTLPTIRPSAMREVFIETPAVKWTDIGGQAEVKQKLKECVEWPLTRKDTLTRLGVEAPKGVLLYGPPGCSKTMTAKALATESGINFIAVKGPELLNKFVGESERAVREIFRKARAAAPSIVFFDEIDALGSSRDGGDSTHGGVLTSLLNEMDGVEELSGVTVVAATNRPDVLDSALMRPGRLDRILYVGAPDLETRKEILKIRFKSMTIEEGVDIDELAKITEGCSGAEVTSICQDAALASMNEKIDAPFVKKVHLIEAAKTVRRRITPEMIRFFENWRDQSGVRSA